MRKIILIADDDTDDTDMFHEALMEIDPTTVFHRATDGHHVLSTLEKHKTELPHLIFLDVNMPRMDGWECLERLKANVSFQNIPVMMYSTSAHPRDIDIALDHGALCFMTKPTGFKELKTILTEILAHLDGNLLEAVRQYKDISSRDVFHWHR